MLDVQHLTKRFGDRTVLDDVTFTVRDGVLTGFVGANGAGKTTTMRCILGVVRPDAGEALLGGHPIGISDRARFGYMPEERGLYPKMKVHEQLVYFAELHGLDRATATRNTDALLEELGLAERRGDLVEALSLGNQQRAQIAAALVHDPEVLILDEPFSGLDPIAVETVLGVLQRYAARGIPVLYSSHQLDVVERLSDELVIISGGVVKIAGNRRALQEEHSRGLHRIVVADDAGWLRDEPGVEVLDFDRGTALFRTTDEQAAQRVLHNALARGPVEAFGPNLVKLSEIYREVI
ncbi:ABC transporter ATP-binding protein [Pseudoclavibacter chungangensis]|uniref:ABC transporter ATP-binding protein n=1 Tax=Pseudoclavibacter chungangensis TaxID=587635 RepID=A0A7J5C462_9MICO|nr:ATP-binding cassette domain-containing protein [Pseudoclavibacter chungangensis]KAB1662580.1 ABC transporter ATP-binding protein [Pseudoclavibacter chungangensis]NYJ68627.1 ABC-2 type transport system ATP-binding protein [Pseudoclavibacter chungangensis]